MTLQQLLTDYSAWLTLLSVDEVKLNNIAQKKCRWCGGTRPKRRSPCNRYINCSLCGCIAAKVPR